jgi:hypothetical protein
MHPRWPNLASSHVPIFVSQLHVLSDDPAPAQTSLLQDPRHDSHAANSATAPLYSSIGTNRPRQPHEQQ